MQFTIDRSKWRCGKYGPNRHGEGFTCMLNPEGFLCCLGHVSCQLGVPQDILLGLANPIDVFHEGNRKAVGVLVDVDGDDCTHTELTRNAIHINDNLNYDDAERESLLTALFQQHGHELVFVGEYASAEARP